MAGILLLLVAVGLGCWLGFGAYKAKSSLEQARNSAQQAKEALLHGDSGDASKWADDAHSHAQAARDATHSLPWNIAAVVPWLGSPFKTGQQISDVVLGLATRRTAAVGGCRYSDITGPVIRRWPCGRATPPPRGTCVEQDIRRMPPDLTLMPGQFQIPDTFPCSAMLARNFRGRLPKLRKCSRILLLPHV